MPMTVKTYLEKRHPSTYGKKIRIIDITLNKNNYDDWTQSANRNIIRVSVTNKFIFIYI